MKMDDLQKYEPQQPHQEVFQYAETVESEDESMQNLLMPILRRWPIVLVTFLIACAIGVPAIWFLMEQMYDTAGAIRISPGVPRIRDDTEDMVTNYLGFINTQADLIKSNKVLNRVADVLIGKDSLFFGDIGDPLMTLRKAVSSDLISIEPARGTELIKIRMTSGESGKAEQIVDAFIEAYMAIAVSEEAMDDDKMLSVLEDERRILLESIDRQREAIRQLTKEYGTGELTSRQEMMLQQVQSLRTELTGIRIRKMSLETRIKMLEDGGKGVVASENMMDGRRGFVNSDPMVRALTANILRYEEQVMIGKQTMQPGNPKLQNTIKILAMLREQMEERRELAGKEYDENIQIGQAENRQQHLVVAKMELKQVSEYERRILKELSEQNIETIEIGYKQFGIDDKQEQLLRTREVYNNVSQRIRNLYMERKRPPRVSVAYYASSVPAKGKRKKMAIAVAFAGMALGTFIAFILAKADKSFQGPDDITKRIGVRVIGTTTGPDHIDRRLLGQQLADDYQAIRANLGLFNGQVSSKVIVITSPGAGDGKTTLAINLAISFAQSGEKVLLIDGDLRKPDITETLNLPRNLRGLQELLSGKDLEKTVYKAGPNGCHILAADRRNIADAFNLLNKTKNREYIKTATAPYDHVIIDTPPVLAFPDAILWTKMADGVILASLVNHTSQLDLREAIKRLEQAGANVLGTVVNNVKVSHSYHRYGYGYGYGYGTGDGAKHESAKRSHEERLLLTAETNKEDNSDVNT
jgi:capsular exopolysaccharide synthesis family protein